MAASLSCLAALARPAAPLAVLAVTLPSGEALAADPTITLGVSAPKVEVGQSFSVELKVTHDGQVRSVGRPRLEAPGLTAGAPSVSTQIFRSSTPNGTTEQRSLRASWLASATRVGKLTLTASVELDGKPTSRKVVVEAVPAGSGLAPPAGPRGQLGPGGPTFPGFPPFPGFPGVQGFPGLPPHILQQLDDDEPPRPPADPALSLPSAPQPDAFLRIVADKTTGVVGEQITLSLYRYWNDTSTWTDHHDPPLTSFLRTSLVKNPGVERPISVDVGGKPFQAQLIEKLAVFPMKTGALSTGKMTARVSGRRVGSRALRESNELVLSVAEPPLDGRPAGYVLGDVGEVKLTASVEPRTLPQDGTLTVLAKVAGFGNFPESLRVPERKGVEWQDPQVKESIEPTGGALGGWRSFGYVVRVRESGKVDLGTLRLAMFNPRAQRYELLEVPLGEVEVTPSASPSPSPSASATAVPLGPSLGELPPPRLALGPSALRGREELPFGAWFGWALGGPPALVLLGLGLTRLAGGAREGLARRGTSPRHLAQVALGEAERAQRGGDSSAALAALERALHLALEHRTGLRTRGVLAADRAAALRGAGLDATEADEAARVLAACEEARFVPMGSPHDANHVFGEARALVKKLASHAARAA